MEKKGLRSRWSSEGRLSASWDYRGLQSVSSVSEFEDVDFRAELDAMLVRAHLALNALSPMTDSVQVAALTALIDGISKEENKNVLKNAYDVVCTCGTSQNLHEAVHRRCLRCCFQRLDQVGSTRESSSRESALHCAAAGGFVEAIELLAPYEHACLDGSADSSLSAAIFRGENYLKRREACQLLLPYTDQTEHLCLTKLIWACLKNDLNEAKAHLEEAAQADSHHRTALMYASSLGYEELVSLLAPKEARRQDSLGFTALMYAAQGGALMCVRRLVKLEAGMTNTFGWTALLIVAENGWADCLQELLIAEGAIALPDKTTALMLAAHRSQNACVTLLMKQAGRRDVDQNTALMFAAMRGNLGVVRLLATKEARLRNAQGKTALMFAAEHGQGEVVQELAAKEAGARIKNGIGALGVAVVRFKLHASKVLMSVQKETRYMPQVCRYAFLGNRPILLKLADTWTAEFQGAPALWFALAGRQLETARMMLWDPAVLKQAMQQPFNFRSLHKDFCNLILVLRLVIVSQGDDLRAILYTQMLLDSQFQEARLLAPFCRWTPSAWLMEKLEFPQPEIVLYTLLSKAGHGAGIVIGTRVLSGITGENKQVFRKFIANNPLWAADVDRARRSLKANAYVTQDGRKRTAAPQPSRQPGVREARLETDFNGGVLLEALTAQYAARSQMTSGVERNAPRILHKKVVETHFRMKYARRYIDWCVGHISVE